MISLVPLNYRVIVKHENVEEFSKGGIYIPDPVRDKERVRICKGVLVAIGPECETTAQVGDTVVYAQQAGRFIKDPKDGLEYTILNDEDLLVVLEYSGGNEEND